MGEVIGFFEGVMKVRKGEPASEFLDRVYDNALRTVENGDHTGREVGRALYTMRAINDAIEERDQPRR